MITITFYFLLCPGEYTGTTSNNTLFHLHEVELHVGGRLPNMMAAPSEDLDATNMVSLKFTRQKHRTKG
jgi:hypothetical protein